MSTAAGGSKIKATGNAAAGSKGNRQHLDRGAQGKRKTEITWARARQLPRSVNIEALPPQICKYRCTPSIRLPGHGVIDESSAWRSPTAAATELNKLEDRAKASANAGPSLSVEVSPPSWARRRNQGAGGGLMQQTLRRPLDSRSAAECSPFFSLSNQVLAPSLRETEPQAAAFPCFPTSASGGLQQRTPPVRRRAPNSKRALERGQGRQWRSDSFRDSVFGLLFLHAGATKT
nr:hypothetical protein Iba_chr07cCG11760 [Ipomoea batatas]